MTQLINPEKFTEATTLLRSFFLARGFQEVHKERTRTRERYLVKEGRRNKNGINKLLEKKI